MTKYSYPACRKGFDLRIIIKLLKLFRHLQKKYKYYVKINICAMYIVHVTFSTLMAHMTTIHTHLTTHTRLE